MSKLLHYSKITVSTILVYFLFLSFANAQIMSKPKLDFEAKLNALDEKIEITWATCLENSILTLMDNGKRPLKTLSLCKDNSSIDVSDLKDATYYVKIEHYTGYGIQAITKGYSTSSSTFSSTSSELKVLEEKSIIKFVAYPNPVEKTLMIELEECLENTVALVIDMNGRTLKRQSICTDGSSIDFSDLAKGVYFIKIEHYTGVGVQRIVKK
jgi:hypothetical protein